MDRKKHPARAHEFAVAAPPKDVEMEDIVVLQHTKRRGCCSQCGETRKQEWYEAAGGLLIVHAVRQLEGFVKDGLFCSVLCQPAVPLLAARRVCVCPSRSRNSHDKACPCHCPQGVRSRSVQRQTASCGGVRAASLRELVSDKHCMKAP